MPCTRANNEIHVFDVKYDVKLELLFTRNSDPYSGLLVVDARSAAAGDVLARSFCLVLHVSQQPHRSSIGWKLVADESLNLWNVPMEKEEEKK
jgi:hypothetical protein